LGAWTTAPSYAAVRGAQTMAKVEILSKENGPNLVMVDGKFVAAICRCGHSGKKPYCDGTHAKMNFVAPGATIPVLD
jgi:CDGSH-type Zn-finger protein